jgi:hypothetical protein
VDDVALHDQVVMDEPSRVGAIGMNAAYFGRGHKDTIRSCIAEEGVYGLLVGEVDPHITNRISANAP